ncbi:5-hydroxytryptamine receptor 6-like [Gigantopelta aegis]|uniref:5-hydroxytryptamine receptor 6-like n=1 Tax=Gigantopelta aegis TaxID=1735272 RepID=UPI001B88DE4D|nr:5-hydroxytryptamine receptor 6-like [Gigantopelta aegis]
MPDNDLQRYDRVQPNSSHVANQGISNHNLVSHLSVSYLFVSEVEPDFGIRTMRVETILIGVTLGLIVFCTIIGNVFVFLAVISNKKLRTVSNYFIVSLSLADLLVGTVVMIPAALNETIVEWVLGVEFCSIWASFDVMLCSASILNVCLISLDRYMSIMTPLRYNAAMTHRRALALLAGTWFVAILTSFVPIQNGWHNIEMPSLENLTFFSRRPQCIFVVSFPYAVTASTVTILLPIIIAFVLYYRVSKVAKRQACFVGTLLAPSHVLLGKPMSSKSIREPFTRKATVTLGIIVGAYVVTWAPFLVVNTVESYCRCLPPRVFISFVWLGYCNSLINPIIYPLFMRDFRKVYGKILKGFCPRFKFLKKASKASKVIVNGNESAPAKLELQKIQESIVGQ